MGTFVHNDSNGGNVTSIPNVTWGIDSAAAQSGDLAIIPWVFLNTETPTDPTSESWSLALANVAGATDCEGRILYRICDGTESGDISGWSTTGAGNRQAAVLYVVRGYDFISGLSVFDETTNSTTHDCPTLTTADGFGGNTPADGDTILVFVFDRAASTTASPPSGWSTRSVSVFAATGTGGTIVGMADDSLTDNATFPVNPGAWSGLASSDDAFTVTLSLRPTSSGDATAAPAVTATTVAAPQATPAVSDTAEPAAIATTVSAPQASSSVSDTGAPAATAATVALPQATISAGATVTPATITAAVTLPSSDRNIGAGPGVLVAAAALPQATPQAGGNATVAPAQIVTTAAMSQAVPIGAAAASPARIVTFAAAPTAIPTVHDVAIPGVLTVVAGLQQPSILSGAGPAPIAALSTLLPPGESISAGPTQIASVVTLPLSAAIDEGAQVNGTSTPTVTGLQSITQVSGLAPAATVAQWGSSTSAVSDG